MALTISNSLGGTNHTDGSNYNGNSDTDNDGSYGANNSGEEIDDSSSDDGSDNETGVAESSEPLMNAVQLAYEKGQSCSLHHILELYI